MTDKTDKTEAKPADANAAFDWDSADTLPEPTVLATKDRVIVPVPDSLVAIAQKSLDEGIRLEYSFRGNERKANAFAALMKGAGDHTKPASSVTVVQDGIVVRVRAGQRRGRKTKDGNGNGNASDKSE